MKRPSGFDRAPERPEPSTPDPAVAPPVTEPPHPDGETAASRLMDRLRTRTARESTQSDTSDLSDQSDLADLPAQSARSVQSDQSDLPTQPDQSAQAAESAQAAPGADGALAPTVDLSAVRRAREQRDDEGLEALGQPSDARSAVAKWRAARQADPVRVAERRVRDAGKLRRARFRRERQRFTLAARRRRRTWWIALGTVGTLALFVVLGAFTPLMAVRDVQVLGTSSVDEAAVRTALARFEGVPLALVNDAEVHRALEPFPLIQRYAVERTPPHTMTVRIEERTPVISLPGEGGVAQYDAAGVLLGAAEAAPAGAPLGAGALEDRSSPAFRSAARALRDMPAELRAQIAGVTASSGQDVTFVLTNGVEVFWGDAEQTRRKALVLSSMLGSLAERPVEHVDVSSSEAPVFR